MMLKDEEKVSNQFSFLKWLKYLLHSYSFYILILFFIIPHSGYAQQTKASLEQKKKKLENEIRETNKLIDETKKNKTLSLSQLTILNKRIKDRQALIKLYEIEVGELNINIKTSNQEINALQTDLKTLKTTYAKVVRNAYIKRGKYVPVIYIFSAQSFNQAYRRLRYLQSYNDFRKKQAAEIQSQETLLTEKVTSLRTDLDSKRVLLNSEQAQREELDKEKIEKESVVKSLTKKEKQLKKDLEKKRANAKKLDAEIARVIEIEIRKERERAAAAAKAAAKVKGEKAPTTTVLKVSPATKLVSDKFESNKGRLPWPVEKGVITEQFGEHRHPVMANIVINNNGINIATSKGATIRAIFEGEVAAVFTVPGGNKAVIVRHGEYLSVYSNLGNISVNQGEKVKVGQVLGTVYTDEDDNKTEAHLEIWKDKTKLNPELWIAR